MSDCEIRWADFQGDSGRVTWNRDELEGDAVALLIVSEGGTERGVYLDDVTVGRLASLFDGLAMLSQR